MAGTGSDRDDGGIAAIVALGNPGDKHERDRHNAGFWLADELAQRGQAVFKPEKRFSGLIAKLSFGITDAWLLKPETFMNRSGQAVQALMAYYRLRPDQLLIAHDDLDLPPGTARLKQGGGHGGHNGLRDVISHVGADFRRLRIGIGHPGRKEEVLNFVLGRPPATEQAAIDASISDCADAVERLFKEGWQPAVQALHSSPSQAASSPSGD